LEIIVTKLQFAALLALSLSMSAPFAQTTAPAKAASAAATRDCEMPRHDHGAEKGTATPKSVRCAAEDAKGKKVQKAHDHNKVHK
jgi:hypothetical protein